MDPITYKLVHPVKFGSEEITELVFKRRPTVADFEGTTPRLTITEQMMILSRMADKPWPMMKMVDGEDAIKLMEVLAGFLQPGPLLGVEA